jgi:hypothetical protein
VKNYAYSLQKPSSSPIKLPEIPNGAHYLKLSKNVMLEFHFASERGLFSWLIFSG